MKQIDVTKALAQKWNDMSDQEKYPFIEMAKQDKIRAEQEYFLKKNATN